MGEAGLNLLFLTASPSPRGGIRTDRRLLSGPRRESVFARRLIIVTQNRKPLGKSPTKSNNRDGRGSRGAQGAPARKTTLRQSDRPKAAAKRPARAAGDSAAKPGRRAGSAAAKAGSRPATPGKRPARKAAAPTAGARKPAEREPAAVVATAVQHVRVGESDDGQRVDNFLLKRLHGVPKSHVYRLLRSGQVRVDGGRVKAERKLAVGEEVRIPPVRAAERETAPRPPDAVLNRLRESIIHEDEHYLAISKPAGLAAHGGSGVPYGVIEAARAWNKYPFLELCHRLDRDTSGVLLLAKSRPALLRAQNALREGTVIKRYFALLAGRLTGGPYDVDAALVRSRVRGGERFVEVDEEDGKPSKSRFTVSQRYRDGTLCEVEIFSGRTHQIRVHALALGAPVAGDRKYGLRDDQQRLRDFGLRRMFLHSHFLQLPASGEFARLMLNAPLPDELREFLDRLR